MRWFKSSYGGSGGGDCAEVTWRKSSYSNSTGGECVEVGWHGSGHTGGRGNCVEVSEGPSVLVRDTRNRPLGHLAFGASSWQHLLRTLAR
ncbi:DUF397 domain-containing protein [Nocardiopsis terrae]